MLDAPSLLQRIAVGDRSAVDDCIEQYGGLIWSIGKRYLRDTADLEDVTQEVFVELWQTADRFDPSRGTEATFVSLLSRRRFIDRLRRRGVETNKLPTQPLEEADEIAIFPVDALVSKEEIERTHRCLETLDSARRQVLVMHLRDGHSHSRISDALNLPLGTIKSHARRGLLQIQKCLGLHSTVGQLSVLQNGDL